MWPALAFDMTRLLLAAVRKTPRGIERVDLDFANKLAADWPGECHGLIHFSGGVRLVARKGLARAAAAVEDIWREHLSPGADPAFQQVCRGLGGTTEAAPPARRLLGPSRQVMQSGYALAKALFSSSRGLRQLGPGALYLNCGHLGFTLPGSASWLRKRTDIQSVAFVHDLLSLDHPEFFRPENKRYFARFMRHGVQDAAALLVATDVVRKRVADCLAATGSRSPPIFVGHLPTGFAPSPALHDPMLSCISYFVMVGTIEPRKNHLLMLNIWRDLCQRGESCPYLVVAGADGWGAAHVHDMLRRSKFIRSRILRVHDLTSGALARLMANACGVLVPSFAEGYSLPLVEALTLQVPTVASDIAVLREVSQGAALHLDPLNGLAWKAAIQHLADRSSPTATRLRVQASRYASPTREPYFQSLFEFLHALAPTPPSRSARDAVS